MALTAVGPDGSYIDLGTVTSDGYYGTFSKTWTPEKERDYKIMRRSLEMTRMEVRRHQHLSRSVLPHTTTTSSAEIVVPDYATALIGGFLAVIIAVAKSEYS